jgi:hypothetical protein
LSCHAFTTSQIPFRYIYSLYGILTSSKLASTIWEGEEKEERKKEVNRCKDALGWEE